MQALVCYRGVMRWKFFRRAGVLALFLAAVAGGTGAVWRYGYLQALDQVARRGDADLALAVDRLGAQLQRYRELAVLMADHPVLIALKVDSGTSAAQALLLAAADKTSALDLFYLNPAGQVLAQAGQANIGDVARAAYFGRAMQGALGTDHGVFGQAARRAYFFAAPSFAKDGQVSGALVVVVNIDNVEEDWRGSNPPVFFTDAGGTVILSNRSELLFWKKDSQGRLAPQRGVAPEFSTGNQGGHDIWHMAWGPYIPARALHLARDLPVIGMRGEALIDVAPARRLAGLQAAVVGAILLAFGALLFLATERRRTLARANAQLETRVEARTAQLKKAQDDLGQAGKLSALGQMSAGISHELNQPLMAIQQFAENGGKFLQRGKGEKAADNLLRISDMAARMARIIKNLRAFARQESIPMGRVDLGAVIDLAVDLTQARLKNDAIILDWQPPETPVFAYGGEVRLGQVFVNLITNAADAMENTSQRRIAISIEAGQRLIVRVRDNGPGIDDPEKIFEPFYTTKTVASGEGMGLGLSISYGLVQSFGGQIRGVNASTGDGMGDNLAVTLGGAIFTVELEYWKGAQ